MTIFSGHELVLIATVPRAGDRWKQVHFNLEIADRFFRLAPSDKRQLRLELVRGRKIVDRVARPVVYSEVNRNFKIEMDFGDCVQYPAEGPPLVVAVEMSPRHVRYLTLLPNQSGFEDISGFLTLLAPVGRGLPRALTTLDDLELHWQNCPLRLAQ
jgi:hypothetical protein